MPPQNRASQQHNSLQREPHKIARGMKKNNLNKKGCVPFDQKRLVELLVWSIPELRGGEE